MDISNSPQVSTLESPELAPRLGPISRPSRVPPGPRGPLSGFRIVRRPLDHIAVDFKGYGDMVHYRIGTMQIFLVGHPDGIKHVLQENHRNYVKSPDYQILKRVLGEGLLTSENPLWLSQRRLMSPIFHRQRIAEFGAMMVDSTLK